MVEFLRSDSRFKSAENAFRYFLQEVPNATSINMKMLKLCYSSELRDLHSNVKSHYCSLNFV